MPSINVQDLKRKMDAGEKFLLIDVREPFEHEIARIDGAKLIPLREIGKRANELANERSSCIATAECAARRRSSYCAKPA